MATPEPGEALVLRGLPIDPGSAGSRFGMGIEGALAVEDDAGAFQNLLVEIKH